ncbi:thioredoxin family protein [Roseateles sp. DC23W]|uniref:Thioredoxin family protein n=1 Tax=Pelomonas dachongensis TaxID=3299029 RepID=A0ABW7ELX7_9BURK
MRFTRRHGAGLLAAAFLLLGAASARAQELRAYPRAQELGRYDNPLEAGALPISPPERAKGKNESRWRLPYEGKVSMQQYKHPADDSPLLIARHYAGQLREQGFELLTICDIPCAGRADSPDASVYWFHELDLAKRLQYNYFGDRGLYLIAHRADAVVAVRVGASHGGYASVVKTVAAPQLDRTPLLAYVERQRAPAADAPLPPAVGGPGTAPAPSAFVKEVAPADLNAWVRATPGWVVVQLSSNDPKCGYCVRANPVFNALAAAESPQGTGFARVAFQPWTSVNQNDFANQYGVSGLPSFFTFKDGQLMRRHNGIADQATLRRVLLDGVR